MKNLLSLVASILTLSVFAQTAIVTNTANSGQGSLRQAIIDANNDAQIDRIEFNIPTTDAGYDATTGVFIIEISGSALPVIDNDNLTIDGASQTAFTGNSNTAILGSARNVGVDQIGITPLDGPEIEIMDGGSRLVYGLKVKSKNFSINNIAIHGFGTGHPAQHGDLVLGRGTDGALVENCAFGISANSLSRPARNTGAYGISGFNAHNVVVDNCIFAFTDNHGIFTDIDKGGCSNWEIKNSQFLNCAHRRINLDGIGLERSTSNSSVENCYVAGNKGCGIDFYFCSGNLTLRNNTIENNGKFLDETPGIRVWGSDNLIEKNVIHSNFGAGIMVVPSSINNTITLNSIANNGNIEGNANAPRSKQIGIDLLEPNKAVKVGNDPFVSLNDFGDIDNGGNDIINHAVVQEAYIEGNKLIIKGFSQENANIEFFKADNYTDAYRPQGITYLFSEIEGGNNDKDNGSAKYGPGPINDYLQGEDSVNLFEFEIPKPSNVNVGDSLCLTTTLNNNTSEFSPLFIVGVKTVKISPVLECVYPEGNGNFSAVFGYFNPNSTTVTIPVGSANRFHPSPQGRGQDTLFNPGRKWAQFEVPFSGGNLVWILDGKTSTASPNSQQCYFDLEVRKFTSKTSAQVNETITFTVEARNKKFKPMTNVVIADTLTSAFTYVSSSANMGSYDPATHSWNIPSIANGDTARLSITVTVNHSGFNKAKLISSDQIDGNPNNNEDEVLVCTDTDCNTSGGNDGGIESNGNLASKLADRAYNQKVKSTHNYYADLSQIPVFNKEKAMAQRSNNLAKYLPQTGPDGAQSLITTPTNLIEVTNAEEMLGLDYYKGSQRLAGILAIRSEAGTVYEHTKVICDRLNGASLENIDLKMIDGKYFIMSKLVQGNGATDYHINFVAIKKGQGEIVIDNKWNIEEYAPFVIDSVFTFQVWSVSPDQTVAMVETILQNIHATGDVIYLNQSIPAIPKVFVKSGVYKNGALHLQMSNEVNASELYIKGNVAVVENGDRIAFDEYINIGPDNELIIETNYLFDAGLSIMNDVRAGVDVIYFADGPWGLDYEETGAYVYNFETKAHDNYYVLNNEFAIERGAHIVGEVESYFNLYRNLRVGGATVDLSDFNQIEFSALSTGDVHDVELTIATNSIENWQNQYKIAFTLEPNVRNNYFIGIPEFTSNDPSATLDLENVNNITFTVKGNRKDWKLFDIDIDEVKFTANHSVKVEEISASLNAVNVYPNPSSSTVFVAFNEYVNGTVNIQLMDQAGRLVKQINSNNSTSQLLQLDVSDIRSGIYFIQIQSENISETKKLSILR